MQLRAVVLALVLLAIAGIASADKAVTFSTVVLTDMQMVSFDRQGTGWRAQGQAVVRSTDGKTRVSTVQITLSPAQQTTLETFITNNFLAPVNTQEGL